MHRILLVEDDPRVRKLYQLELEEAGCAVRATADVSEARRLTEVWHPDCVVMDIQLGEDNGLSLLRRLLERRPGMRAVLLSAYPGYQDDFASWLADAFVLKSSDPAELIQKIEDLLGARMVV